MSKILTIEQLWDSEIGGRYDTISVVMMKKILEVSKKYANQYLEQQRDLLIGCIHHTDSLDLGEFQTVEEQVDDYLKSINDI